MGGDRDNYLKHLNSFIQVHAADPAKLRELWQSQEISRACQMANELQMAAANLSIDLIAQIADNIEKHMAEQTDYDMEQAFQRLERDMAELTTAMTGYHEDDTQEELDLDAARVINEMVLQELYDLLSKSDNTANELFHEHRETLLQTHPELTERLTTELNDYDYPSALTLLIEHLVINAVQPGLPESPEQTAESTNEVAEPKAPRESAIDLSVLESTFGGRSPKIITMLEKFAVQIEVELPNLQQAIELKNIEAVRFLAHKLKSSSKAMGAMPMSNICLQIEMAAKAENLEEIQASIGNLQTDPGHDVVYGPGISVGVVRRRDSRLCRLVARCAGRTEIIGHHHAGRVDQEHRAAAAD